jgi:hypothetical protein
MTDDDNAGWNAARSVYGSGLQQLLNANSESDFEQYKTSLVSKLETINPSFLKYLTDHYFNRPEK